MTHRTPAKATLKEGRKGTFYVKIGNTVVGRGRRKEAVALRTELNASPRKRKLLRDAVKRV